jgi:hypothetical protein
MMYLRIDTIIKRILNRARHITQCKRYVPYSAHPNFCFAKTSFILRPLDEIIDTRGTNER